MKGGGSVLGTVGTGKTFENIGRDGLRHVVNYVMSSFIICTLPLMLLR